MTYQYQLHYSTKKRGIYLLSDEIATLVTKSKVVTGVCHIFLQHTSASLILCENADPAVHTDLEMFMQRLIPDGDAIFTHTHEGPDDMPAHVRTILTQNSLTIPVAMGVLALGRWQGIYLWEHRHAGHDRKMIVTVM